MLLAYTRDRELAEDVFQETFRIVIEKLRGQGLDKPGGLRAYLYQTARNQVMMAHRSAGRTRTVSDTELVEMYRGRDPDQPELVQRHQEALYIRRLIRELNSERDQLVLYLFYLKGLDRNAICAALKLEADHFYRVVHRARKRFRALCEKDGLSPQDWP